MSKRTILGWAIALVVGGLGGHIALSRAGLAIPVWLWAVAVIGFFIIVVIAFRMIAWVIASRERTCNVAMLLRAAATLRHPPPPKGH